MIVLHQNHRFGYRLTRRVLVGLVTVSLAGLAVAAPSQADDGNALNSVTSPGPGKFQLTYTSLASSVSAVVNRQPRADFWTTVQEGTGTTTVCGTGCRAWQDSAQNDTLWYPQGLAGTLESNWNAPPPQQIIASGWYKRATATSSESTASAIKFMFTDAAGAWKYRHVELRTASSTGTTSALAAHVGGLAWAGSFIYVADTDTIYRFDVRDIFKDGSTAYLVPSAKYVNVAGKATRLSSLSTDWSTSPPALVSAQWNDQAANSIDTDVVRWPLNAGAGLVTTGSIVNSVVNYKVDKDSSIDNVQGVASKDGLYYFSGSGGRLDRARVDSQTDRAGLTTWGVDGGIPQDLYLEKGTNRMFGQTEKPGKRQVFWNGSPF